jgi:hypothetical protein
VGLSTIDEKERVNIDNALKLIEEKTIPTEKQSKHQKKDQLLLNKDIINELKKNLRVNTGDKYIKYSPTDWSEINKITKLDVKKDIEVIKKVHSMVTNNEINANAFALHEAYYRGKLYFKIKSKFSDNKAFIDYCEETFDISSTVIYTYLNVYYLCEEFPSILLSGFGVNKLYKYSKLISKSAKEDNDLNILLTKPFPGIKSDNIRIDDPTIEDLNEINEINIKS